MSYKENHNDNLEKSNDCIDSIRHDDLFKFVQKFFELQNSKQSENTQKSNDPN
jgi:hypothetical protein